MDRKERRRGCGKWSLPGGCLGRVCRRNCAAGESDETVSLDSNRGSILEPEKRVQIVSSGNGASRGWQLARFNCQIVCM